MGCWHGRLGYKMATGLSAAGCFLSETQGEHKGNNEGWREACTEPRAEDKGVHGSMSLTCHPLPQMKLDNKKGETRRPRVGRRNLQVKTKQQKELRQRDRKEIEKDK